MKMEISFDIAYCSIILWISNEKERGKGKRQAFCSFNPQRSRMNYYSYVKGYVTVVEIGLGEPESIESSFSSLFSILPSLRWKTDRQTDEIFVSECNEVSVLHI